MINPDIELEKSLWRKGFINVAGLDEVGRGPLAGPVVAGAVIIHREDQFLEGVRDSKKMTEKKRDFFFEKIKDVVSGWGVGVVSSEDIDTLGISKAVLKAMQLALLDAENMIGKKSDYLIVDGPSVLKIPGYEMTRMKSGDLLHYSISAASVLAKVTRDRMMIEDYALKYPEYGFEKHVGYGTKFHMDALEKYGPCPIHRRSFSPIAKLLKKDI